MPPNILCVVMDDLRADFLSLYGTERPATPNMDRIARRGLHCRNAFVTTPICTPGRAELLTGCHPWRNGVPWFEMPIAPDRPLLPRHFADAGYHTIHVGKWHNDGLPHERGFTRTRRVFCRGSDLVWKRGNHYCAWPEQGRLVSGHSSELYVEAAIEEIDAAPGDRPWLAWVAPTAPHDPFICPEPFQSRYDRSPPPLPDNFMPEHPFDTGDLTIRDEKLLPWPRRIDAVRRYRARYWGIIDHLDHCLGRLFDHLEASGQANDTIIVITGDHGLAVGDHGLLGKCNMYDHSCRVPLILAGPGVPTGCSEDGQVSSADLLPTLCDLSGIEPPPELDGRALIVDGAVDPAARRAEIICAMRTPADDARAVRLGIPETDPRVHALAHDPDRLFNWPRLWDTQRSLRTCGHKLTWFPLIGRFQLFDLQEDPDECHDLLRCWRWQRHGFMHPRQDPAPVRAQAAGLREQMIAALEARDDGCVAILKQQHIPEEMP